MKTKAHKTADGKTFPNMYSVEDYRYNGYTVTPISGFKSFQVKKLLKWTNDPGIGLFLCSDKKVRLIPSCQLHPSFLNKHPKQFPDETKN